MSFFAAKIATGQSSPTELITKFFESLVTAIASGSTSIFDAAYQILLNAAEFIIDFFLKLINLVFSGKDNFSKALHNFGVSTLTEFRVLVVNGSGNITGIVTGKVAPDEAVINCAMLIITGFQECLNIMVHVILDLIGNEQLSRLLNGSLDNISDLFNEILAVVKHLNNGGTIESALSSVASILAKILVIAKDMALKLADSAGGKVEIAGPLKSFIDQQLTNFGDFAIDSLNVASKTFSGELALPDAIVGEGQILLSSLSRLLQISIETLLKFIRGDGKFATNVREAFDSAITASLNLVLKPIDLGVQISDTVFQGSDPVSVVVRNLIHESCEGVKLVVVRVAGNLTGIISGEINLKDAVTSIGLTINDLIGEVVDRGLKQMIKLSKSANGPIAATISLNLKAIRSSSQTINKVLNQLSSNEISPIDALGKILDSILKTIRKIYEMIDGMLYEIYSGDDPISEAVRSSLDALLTILEDSIDTELATVVDVIGGKVSIDSGLKTIANTGINTVSKMVTVAAKVVTNSFPGKDGLSGLTRSTASLIATATTKIAEACVSLISGKSSAIDTISTIASTIVEALKSLLSLGGDALRSILDIMESLGLSVSPKLKAEFSALHSSVSKLIDGDLEQFFGTKNIISRFLIVFIEVVLSITDSIGSLFTAKDKCSGKVRNFFKVGLRNVGEVVEVNVANAATIISNTLSGKTDVISGLRQFVENLLSCFTSLVTALVGSFGCEN